LKETTNLKDKTMKNLFDILMVVNLAAVLLWEAVEDALCTVG
jgi:hypothetical protein